MGLQLSENDLAASPKRAIDHVGDQLRMPQETHPRGQRKGPITAALRARLRLRDDVAVRTEPRRFD